MKYTLSLAFLSLILLAGACKKDDGDPQPSVEEQIGEHLEGTWNVTESSQDNPDDYYESMVLTFGPYTKGSGGSLTVSGIDADLIPDFGTMYNFAGTPSSVSSFTLTVNGVVAEIAFQGSNDSANSYSITFENEDGVQIGGARTSGATGIGEYMLVITKAN